MPAQLPLPIRLRAASVFASFVEGDNGQVLATLRAWRMITGSPLQVLYGVSGTGKSHLLQALCADASSTQELALYLPLNELQQYGPEVLVGAEQARLICIDDVHRVAPQPDWNRALFNLHRECDERRTRLVLAADQPPAAWSLVLPDLASRVMAGQVMRVQPLTEAQQQHAMQLHARQRGFDIPDEVAQYLLRRLPRDMHSLCSFIDQLDVALLSAQRRLTVPFVRQLLDGNEQA